jgi:predicted SprT family Zn-dependent metalloprotease
LLEELLHKAKFYTKELWNKEYNGLVRQNNRLRSTFAWYVRPSKWNEGLPVIEFSKETINTKNELFIDDILIHELCHWYCQSQSEPYEDGHPNFENKIRLAGVRSTMHFDIKDGNPLVADTYIHYQCLKCGKRQMIISFDAEENRSWYGSCCDGKFNLRGWQQGEYIPYWATDKLVQLNQKYKSLFKMCTI